MSGTRQRILFHGRRLFFALCQFELWRIGGSVSVLSIYLVRSDTSDRENLRVRVRPLRSLRLKLRIESRLRSEQ